MKPPHPEHNEQDDEMIKRLRDLGSVDPAYPPELLKARRAAFLAHVDQLVKAEAEAELNPRDQEVISLLGTLKSVKVEYPPDLLAARRVAFLQQMRTAGTISVMDRLRLAVQRLFPYKIEIPRVPLSSRASLVAAALMLAAVIGSLLFGRPGEGTFRPSLSGGVAAPTRVRPTSSGEVAILICTPQDQSPSCSPPAMDESPDLAEQGNGAARPAVSSETQASNSAADQAAYVNDGRSDTTWVSNRPDSWVKIDLGKVATINTVTLQNGSPGSGQANDPGQFVVAVALSDVYSDGNSSNDHLEYAQVFSSQQSGFSGTVSQADTVRALFSPVKARFVKITFVKAGAAIREVGVFMVQPPVQAARPTRTQARATATLLPTSTGLPTDTGTSYFTSTPFPTETLAPLPTGTQIPTETLIPSPTGTPVPTETLVPLPTDTATPIPTNPLPSDTPVPSATAVSPPTAIPPTIQALPATASNGPIVVTSSNQILTFTCNGGAVEVRGHNNTVDLSGDCSSITVTGSSNQVFWHSGSPVITNKGNNNVISQR